MRIFWKSRKISGPLLDRIDIHIEVPNVKYSDFNIKNGESSEQIRKRVNKARQIQLKRYEKYNIFSNAELTPSLIEKFCKLDEQSQKTFEVFFKKLNFSARAYSRILKLARTIADLDEKENIELIHITEAIQYRSLDKNNEN